MLRTALLGIATASMALAAGPAEARHGNREYDDRGRYYEPREVSSRDVWRGRDGRYYCRRGNGTTGLVIGAAGGALLGREVDGGRNRTTGTILGAAAGALIGREVQRSMRCR